LNPAHAKPPIRSAHTGEILPGSGDWDADPSLEGGQVAILRLHATCFDVISVSYSSGGDVVSPKQPASSKLDGYSALLATDAPGRWLNRMREHATPGKAAMVIRDTIPLVSLHLE
jgi:hypothetical protein